MRTRGEERVQQDVLVLFSRPFMLGYHVAPGRASSGQGWDKGRDQRRKVTG